MPVLMIAAVLVCLIAMTEARVHRPRNCIICGHPVAHIVFYSEYCPVCRRFMYIGLHRYVRRRALMAAWNKEADAFLCGYTGIKVDLTSPFGPFYLTFDHAIPGDNSRFIVCCRFVNEMKNELSETEFRTNIVLLANHFRTGEPIDRSLFKADYYRSKPVPTVSLPAILYRLSGPFRPFSPACRVCGKPPEKNWLDCRRCGNILNLESHDIDAKIQALRDCYDRDADAFRCHYTGFILDLDDRASPWHLNFDHVIPSQPGKYWLACQIINLMKSALSEDEFRAVVIELARHFETGEAYNRDVIKFEYWNRPGY